MKMDWFTFSLHCCHCHSEHDGSELCTRKSDRLPNKERGCNERETCPVWRDEGLNEEAK